MDRRRLTPRQREVLDLLAKRYTNQQIADELGISLDGAKWHVREILEATGASSREEAAEMRRAETGLPRRLWRMTWGAGKAATILGGAASVLVVSIAVFIAFRGGGDDEPPVAPEPTATATSTVPPATPTSTATTAPTRPPTATPGVLPPPSRAVGNTFMDYVTSHVESNTNVTASDLAGQSLPCSTEEFNTSPPCPEGAAAGTPVLSVITFSCDVGWVPLTAELNIVEGGQRLRLHSLVIGGPGYTRPPAAPASPDYWMLFTNATPNPPAGYAVAVKDDKIVSWGHSCGPFETLQTRLLEDSTGYLLPPP